jgi:tether containing UBX domain for GLUT4
MNKEVCSVAPTHARAFFCAAQVCPQPFASTHCKYQVATNRELRALTLEGLGLSGGTNALLRVAYRSTQDQFELFVASDDTNATLENAERDQAESERQARVADAKEKALIAQRQQQEAQARAQHQSQEEQKRRDEERQRLVAQHEEARQRQLIAEERARERAREAEARAHASKVAEQKEREEALNAPLRPSAFVSSRISTTPVIPSTFAKEDMMDVDEPKIDRETKVLMASDTPFDISQFEFPPSFYAHTPDDMAEAMKQQRAVKAKQEADQAVMKTQAMREKERLQRLARYKRCYIRVRFPDRTELQGTFLPTEQTTDVMEFVREALREPNLPFYLYTTPPPTKLSDTKNIRDQSFLPAAQVFFGLPQGVQAPTPFLKEEFLREIKEKAPTAVGVYSAPTTLNLTAPPSSHNVGSMGNSRSSNSAQSGGGDRMDTSGGDSKAVPKWFQAGLKKK